MITVKQFEEKWRIKIDGEEWEVNPVGTLKEVLEKLIDLKERYGKLNSRGREYE